jgi:hypothetical protein
MSTSVRTVAGLAGTAAIGVLFGWQLSTYGVPIDVDIAHGAMAWALALALLTRLTERVSASEHRCPDPGCDFQVRLTQPADGEEAMWAKVAADHPAHAYRPWQSR